MDLARDSRVCLASILSFCLANDKEACVSLPWPYPPGAVVLVHLLQHTAVLVSPGLGTRTSDWARMTAESAIVAEISDFVDVVVTTKILFRPTADQVWPPAMKCYPLSLSTKGDKKYRAFSLISAARIPHFWHLREQESAKYDGGHNSHHFALCPALQQCTFSLF